MPTTTTANPPSPPNTHALPGRYYPLSVLPRAASALALGPLCKSQQEKHREALSLSLSVLLSLVWDYYLRTPKPKRFHSLVHFYLSLLSLCLPLYLPPPTTPPPLLVNDFASCPFLHKLPSSKDPKANSHARARTFKTLTIFYCSVLHLLSIAAAIACFLALLYSASCFFTLPLTHFRTSLLGWRISFVEYVLALSFLQPHSLLHTPTHISSLTSRYTRIYPPDPGPG
ncbi:uncharacterized protein CLUP02_08529 [Colletotrichum lupini]|uniref:Uncharacterized protein n=1 Tax=Colletotrichum lupini TaxID=145971 RepID=A0A9Q8SSZ6_9PEZI|nr:uncharacterized protein CLUP02_08529 [Colletotrichum lupini]UQC83039.1 hypothetical protein CLUP02_08529 [Colletotrichum lupini]